jgi:CzcA family heavy metal efflux pump
MVLTVLLCLAGALAMLHLPSGVYPELSFPRIAVIASLGDSPPDQAVISATRPLEEACAQVDGVRWVRSRTIRGGAEISVEFDPRTDMQAALGLLESRVQEVRGSLPVGTGLTVERITPAIFPVLNYNLRSPTLTRPDLYELARYTIQPRLQQLPGVARVQIHASDLPEVAVQVDPEKLRQAQLDLAQVSDSLRRANQIQTLGRLDLHGQQHLVVDQQQVSEPAQLEDFVLTVRNGVPIRLRDVARAEWGVEDATRKISVHGQPGVSINLFRQPTSPVVALAGAVEAEVADLRASLPPGASLERAYDISGLIVDALASVRDAILQGIVLIVVVLWLFLRNWRSTLIAALSIPLSALSAMAVLWLFGQSLNLMSLGGLAVAMGLVVDDAIVVVENIDRQLKLGLEPGQAVRRAFTELVGPVTSSTLTTVVVFLPLKLLSGVAGQFFTSLVVTLAAAVLFSWFFSLTLIPVLAGGWLRSSAGQRPGEGLYGRLLRPLLRLSWLGPLLSLLCLIGTGLVLSRLGSDFLPSMDEGSYIVDTFAPEGTSLVETDRLVREVEKVLGETPEVRTWSRRTGAENGLFATMPNHGDITVSLRDKNLRRRDVFAVMEEQRAKVAERVPQLTVEFHQLLQDQINDLSGTHSPVEVRVFGDDAEKLRTLAAEVLARLEKVPGLVDLTAEGQQRVPMQKLQIDPLRAERAGLSVEAVNTQVRDALSGRVATQIPQLDRVLNVRVRLLDRFRLQAESLPDLPIVNARGESQPLSALASLETAPGEVEILRQGQQRYALILAELEGIDLGTAVQATRAALRDLQLPQGFHLQVGGLLESQRQAFTEMVLMLGLALTLVYLVLVVQFRSYLLPLAILAAVPPGVLGLSTGLLICGISLNVSSLMGLILLVGLVVKNGIILVEYALRLAEEGLHGDEALVRAGSVRLRPILMTSLCSLLGLLPLALGWGAGAELQKPLAVAVISGLSVSTLVTLFTVPLCVRWLRRVKV